MCFLGLQGCLKEVRSFSSADVVTVQRFWVQTSTRSHGCEATVLTLSSLGRRASTTGH